MSESEQERHVEPLAEQSTGVDARGADQPTEHATDQPAEQETGHAGVDAVVASLDGLDDAPVADHVAVFEQAHESLRRALSDAGDGAPTRS